MVAVALLSRNWLQRRFEAQLYLARVEREFRKWGHDEPGRKSQASAQTEYDEYLRHQDREAEIERWAERARDKFGVDPRSWHDRENDA